MSEFEKVREEVGDRLSERQREWLKLNVPGNNYSETVCTRAYEVAMVEELTRLELRMRAMARAVMQVNAGVETNELGFTLVALEQGNELP